MTIQDAKDYINYGIKEGCFDPEDFDGMTDTELEGFAEYAAGRAEMAYDAMREDGEL